MPSSRFAHTLPQAALLLTAALNSHAQVATPAATTPTPAPAAEAPAEPAAVSPEPSPLLPPPGTITSPAPAAAAPSNNFSVNLLKRLVERGALTQKDAQELILLAEADTSAAAAAAAAPPPPPTPPPVPQPDELRVTYVPETVRNRIRDEVRDQLKAEAKSEGWFSERPDSLAWAERVDPFADIRIRYQFDHFPAGNDNTGAFPNLNAINTGAPFDISGNEFSPQYNVDQERQRARLRFRLGAELDLEDHFALGFRFATGQDNSPVSANQSLGWAGNGQGGNFSKYAIWLDRAFLAWEPNSDARIMLGRFDNPFFSTTNIWANEIGFDGLAVQLESSSKAPIEPFLTAGAFPVFNTDFNFSSIQPAKFKSDDKWLYAIQAGADFKIAKDLKGKAAVGYYHFQNIEGRLSDPFTPLSPKDQGNTDATRPSFAQKGNTYRALRNIVPSEVNGFGTRDQYQYFGLASPFHVLTATGSLDYDGWEPMRLSLNTEFAKNLAFDRHAIDAIAVNNRGPVPPGGSSGAFDGKDTAWFIQLTGGDPALSTRHSWNVYAAYRYIGSDAVVDGFNEQFFGGGGTNLKGFTLGAGFALTPHVNLGLEWSSSDQISGPALRNDIFLIDFAASF